MAKQTYVADKKIVQAMRELVWARRRGSTEEATAAFRRAVTLTEAKLQYEAEERERLKEDAVSAIRLMLEAPTLTVWYCQEIRRYLGYYPDLRAMIPEHLRETIDHPVRIGGE